MFGRKDTMENPENIQQEEESKMQPAPRNPLADAPRTLSPAAGPLPARRMEAPRGAARRAPTPERPMLGGAEERKLTVGKGLSLSGEITACDVLVVEGKVEAKLSDGKLLEITETGQFRGSVEIENADIAGRYDGDLTVHGRLTVRGTGRISGMIKYGELEVNAGGQIIGEMQVVGEAASGKSGSSFKSAAKFTAMQEEEEVESEGALFARKAS